MRKMRETYGAEITYIFQKGELTETVQIIDCDVI